jgi:beta-1,2-mannobiose phosphorylase / 1,2-beta-oligomannan phosphorylase
MPLMGEDPHQLSNFTSHHRLAAPVSPWEALKIGSGAPPVMTRHGWLIVYHGVSDVASPNSDEHRITYSAGVMMLSKEHPQKLLYRSTESGPVPPALDDEPRGTPSNVVFPTGIDRRDDIGRLLRPQRLSQPDRLDVYYGINDSLRPKERNEGNPRIARPPDRRRSPRRPAN